MSDNPYTLASDDYLIAIALKRDILTDLERELVKRLEAALHKSRLMNNVDSPLEDKLAYWTASQEIIT